ncbi:hypothetical protein JW711_03960 [Candidatus Woesearchaeota archaeon]|nr:hypothetical protein [Candidatus Woesearchaeota archaeon]
MVDELYVLGRKIALDPKAEYGVFRFHDVKEPYYAVLSEQVIKEKFSSPVAMVIEHNACLLEANVQYALEHYPALAANERKGLENTLGLVQSIKRAKIERNHQDAGFHG